ncbi:MAG: HlyD family secretion protein [Fibrobacteres bacterium]|jgi:membrane fusion protein (multidrug efflux system)|nr:HlyD family secretion protein [Fibrobacterota bacterium]
MTTRRETEVLDGETAARGKAPKKKNTVRNVILLAFLAVGLFYGIRTWRFHLTHATTDDAQVEGHILPVSPKVGGFVAHIFVADEQEVKPGDTLFTIDNAELAIKLRQAEADLLAAEASAKGGVAGAGAHVAEAQRTAAEANLAAAKASLDKAKSDLERARRLFQQQIASKAQLDAAEAAFQSAQATYQSSSEAARGSSFSIQGANAQVRAADARLAATQAAVDAARLQLAYSAVIAPSAGHIAKKNLEPGQLVSPGQMVMAIVEATPPWVVANLKETQLEGLRPGQPVDVDVDAFPDRTFHGKLASIQYATGAKFSLLPPDNATGNFTKVVQRVPVRIDLTDADAAKLLRPGMSATVAVDTRAGE